MRSHISRINNSYSWDGFRPGIGTVYALLCHPAKMYGIECKSASRRIMILIGGAGRVLVREMSLFIVVIAVVPSAHHDCTYNRRWLRAISPLSGPRSYTLIAIVSPSFIILFSFCQLSRHVRYNNFLRTFREELHLDMTLNTVRVLQKSI